MNKYNKKIAGGNLYLLVIIVLLAVVTVLSVQLVGKNADSRNRAAGVSCAGTNVARACIGQNDGDPCTGGFDGTCQLTKGQEKAGCGCIANGPTATPTVTKKGWFVCSTFDGNQEKCVKNNCVFSDKTEKCTAKPAVPTMSAEDPKIKTCAEQGGVIKSKITIGKSVFGGCKNDIEITDYSDKRIGRVCCVSR